MRLEGPGSGHHRAEAVGEAAAPFEFARGRWAALLMDSLATRRWVATSSTPTQPSSGAMFDPTSRFGKASIPDHEVSREYMKMGSPCQSNVRGQGDAGGRPKRGRPDPLLHGSAGRRGEASGPFGVRRAGPVQAMTARRRLEGDAPLSTSPRAGLLPTSSSGPRCFPEPVIAALRVDSGNTPGQAALPPASRGEETVPPPGSAPTSRCR